MRFGHSVYNWHRYCHHTAMISQGWQKGARTHVTDTFLCRACILSVAGFQCAQPASTHPYCNLNSSNVLVSMSTCLSLHPHAESAFFAVIHHHILIIMCIVGSITYVVAMLKCRSKILLGYNQSNFRWNFEILFLIIFVT
jgi:hypothetical protein